MTVCTLLLSFPFLQNQSFLSSLQCHKNFFYKLVQFILYWKHMRNGEVRFTTLTSCIVCTLHRRLDTREFFRVLFPKSLPHFFFFLNPSRWSQYYVLTFSLLTITARWMNNSNSETNCAWPETLVSLKAVAIHTAMCVTVNKPVGSRLIFSGFFFFFNFDA